VSAAEDRLRDALAARAGLVTHVPPGAAARVALLVTEGVDPQVAERAAAERARVAHRRRLRLLAPLAAAAAVCVVVVTALLVVRPADPPSAGAVPAGFPPYFITTGSPAAAVWTTATGRLTTTLPAPPAGGTWNVATTTADPRLFYLSATTTQGNIFDSQRDPRVSLFRLRLTAAGGVASLAPVAELRRTITSPVATSPDGRRIAYPADTRVDPGATVGTAEIVVDVATVFTAAPTFYRSSVPGRPVDLSWDASGRYLAFRIVGSHDKDGVWILDTHAGRDLFAASRRVSALPHDPNYAGTLLPGDGETLYATVIEKDGGKDWIRVVALGVRTSTRRVIFQTPSSSPDLPAPALARDPTGRGLLMVDETLQGFQIDPATGDARRFTLKNRTTSVTGLAW
jgi:hypothetical protein